MLTALGIVKSEMACINISTWWGGDVLGFKRCEKIEKRIEKKKRENRDQSTLA